MKKIILAITICIVMSLSSCKTKNNALVFEKKEEGYIVSISKSVEKVIIPTTYKGLPVVAVKEGAFLKYTIKEIDMPNTIQKIGDDAFNYDYGLIINYDGTKEEFEKIEKGLGWKTDNMTINYKTEKNDYQTRIKLEFNQHTFYATLVENSSTVALIEKLRESSLVIEMEDYGNFEKVGNLGFCLPRNDERITTTVGDLILYQGTSLTIYYDTNTWNFTRLGRIEHVMQQELKDALGSGNVSVTISLA